MVSVLQAEACNTDTTPTQPHRNSNTHWTKSNMTNVVIQQNSRKLLMMDILMSETCWAHKKWNKIASDIKLVCYSSTIGRGWSRIGCWREYLGLRGKREKGNGEKCKMRSLMISTAHQTLFEWSNEEGWDGMGMWHVWETGEVYMGL